MTAPRYMLDTNIVSDLINNPRSRAGQHIAKIGSEGLCVSLVVAAELRFGCAKKGSKRLTERVEAVLGTLDIQPLKEPVDIEYARIRFEAESKGRPLGANDLWIAAHACALGIPLATANEREFLSVRGLLIENWLR